MAHRQRLAFVSLLLVMGLGLATMGLSIAADQASTSPGWAPVAPSPTPALPALPPGSLYAAGGPVAPGPIGEILAQVELAAPSGARKWAVVYCSMGVDGSPIGVSGLIIAPTNPPRPDEPPRTVLSIGHATTGLGDICAPSRNPSDGLVVTARPLLDQGFVLAVTDYEGLGTPGPHPYIVGASEARSMLDAALAAQALAGTGAGPRTLLVGGSQGGHAVLWAADLAASVAPSLDVVGAVAFAPAGDLEAIARYDRSPDAGADAWWSSLLLVEAWHEVYGLPLDVLTPPARALAARLGTDCDTAPIDEAPIAADLSARPDWSERLRDNTPAQQHTDVPVVIFQGSDDEVVPIESTRAQVARMCAVRDTVDLRVLPGADHRGSLTNASLLAAVAWVADRLDGVPARSVCSVS